MRTWYSQYIVPNKFISQNHQWNKKNQCMQLVGIRAPGISAPGTRKEYWGLYIYFAYRSQIWVLKNDWQFTKQPGKANLGLGDHVCDVMMIRKDMVLGG